MNFFLFNLLACKSKSVANAVCQNGKKPCFLNPRISFYIAAYIILRLDSSANRFFRNTFRSTGKTENNFFFILKLAIHKFLLKKLKASKLVYITSRETSLYYVKSATIRSMQNYVC